MKNYVSLLILSILSLAGCTLSSQVNLPQDDQSPFVLALADPADGSTNGSILTIKGSVYHAQELSAGYVLYTLSTGGITNRLELGKGGQTLVSLYGQLSLTPGSSYYVWLSAQNIHGRQIQSTPSRIYISAQATNHVDTVPPVLGISAPTNLQRVGSSLTVNGTVTDTDSGVQSVFVSLNDGPYVSATLNGINWSRNLSLIQGGNNTLKIYARDIAGNNSDIQTRTVVLDNAVPSVNITSPQHGLITNASVLNISGTASVTGSTLSGVWVKINSGSWQNAEGTLSWSRTLGLTEGWNTLQALAVAENGYSNTSSAIQVRLDSMRPLVSVTAPVNGSSLSGNVSFSGTASDSGSGLVAVCYRLNSGSWKTAAGTNNWSALTNLQPGSYQAQFFALDLALNSSLTSTVSFTVTNNSIPAPETAASPAGGDFYASSVSVTLSLTGSGITAARYTTDGSDPALGGQTFTHGQVLVLGSSLAADQSLSLRLYAANSSGFDTASYTFTKRSGDIKPYITNPTLGKYVNSGTVLINGQKGGSEWTDDMLIALDFANDDPRSLGDNWTMHETPWDITHLYACWDDNNLYLGWQYVDTTDIYDPSNAGSSSGTKVHQMNLLQLLIIDTIQGQGATHCMWNKNGGEPYFGGSDLPEFQVYVAGNLWQGYISEAVNGEFVVDDDGTYYQKFVQNPAQGTTVGTAVGTRGIEIAWITTCVPEKLWGVDDADKALADPINPADIKDFNTMGHDKSRDTFYEMKIPFTALGITRAYLESNGIGVKLGQGEYSCMDTIPQDLATSDTPGVTQSNSPNEWEDEDLLTTPFARIGKSK